MNKKVQLCNNMVKPGNIKNVHILSIEIDKSNYFVNHLSL